VNFSLNMNSSAMVLTFSKPVDRLTLNASGLVLSSTSTGLGPSVALSLSSALSSNSNGRLLAVSLGAADMNRIKYIPPLCTSALSSYLGLMAGSVQDMYGNNIASSVSYVGAGVFVAAETSPQVLQWSLNMTAGTLTLLFSETVNISTISATAITLQNKVAGSTETVALHSALQVMATQSGASVTLVLSNQDLNSIKSSVSIGKFTNATYLACTTFLALSMTNVANKAVVPSAALPIASFFADSVAPVLVAWNIDLDQGYLTLVFSEVIQTNSLVVQLITLHTFANKSTGQNLSLTNSSVVLNTTTSDVTSVQLSVLDWSLAENLFTGVINQTFLSLSASAVLDVAGNGVTTMPTGLAVTSLTLHVAPQLVTFALDMNSKTASLTFHRGMSAYFVASAVQIVSYMDSSSVTLTGGLRLS